MYKCIYVRTYVHILIIRRILLLIPCLLEIIVIILRSKDLIFLRGTSILSLYLIYFKAFRLSNIVLVAQY